MSVVLTKHGDNILEIDDSTETESTFYNWDEITLRPKGDLMIITQIGVSFAGEDKEIIDFNDVTTPSGTVSGVDLVRTISALF